MASPIAIDHRRVHSESGLFIGEEVVCLQTDIDEAIKTSKFDIDNDTDNIINIDHGNGDVELSISCSTTDGLTINDIIPKGEDDDGGGSELMSIVTSYDVDAEEEEEKAMIVDSTTSTATENRELTVDLPNNTEDETIINYPTNNNRMSPSSKILRNLRQKIAYKVKIAKNRIMIPTSPAFSSPLTTPLSPKAKLELATSNSNSTINKEKENEGTNSESTCDMTHIIDHSEEDDNSSSVALPTSSSVVQQPCTKEEPTLNTSSNECDESTNSRSTKSSTNTRESSREIESTSSSITVSTCDFGSINGNHGGKLNEHAIFENYLLTSPWEAAKNGDYATLSYIVNHENDVNIWIQKDEEGHVPLYYACTSYNNYKDNSGKYGLECIKLLLRVWPLEHLPPELLHDNTGNNEEEEKKGTAERSNYDMKKIHLHEDVLQILSRSSKSQGQLTRHKTIHRYSPGLELPEIREQTSSLSDGGIVVEGVSEQVVPFSFLEDLGDDGYVEDY